MLAGSFDELSGKVIRIGHMGENARLEHMVPALEALSATLTDLGVTLQGNLADLFFETLQGVSGLICLNRLTP